MNARCVAVFHGVIEDVLRVLPQVVLVADDVFPEPLMPDASGRLAALARRNGDFVAPGGKPSSGEGPLDLAPASRKVRIAAGERPDTVQVVGQQNRRKGFKGTARAGLLDGHSEQSASKGGPEQGTTRAGDDSEEECAAGDKGPREVRQCQALH